MPAHLQWKVRQTNANAPNASIWQPWHAVINDKVNNTCKTKQYYKNIPRSCKQTSTYWRPQKRRPFSSGKLYTTTNTTTRTKKKEQNTQSYNIWWDYTASVRTSPLQCHGTHEHCVCRWHKCTFAPRRGEALASEQALRCTQQFRQKHISVRSHWLMQRHDTVKACDLWACEESNKLLNKSS